MPIIVQMPIIVDQLRQGLFGLGINVDAIDQQIIATNQRLQNSQNTIIVL